jgi:hypothetical protein
LGVYLTGVFDKRLTAACSSLSSCFRTAVLCQSGHFLPLHPRLVPLFTIADLSPRPQDERSRQRWPAPSSDSVILFLVRPLSHGAKHLEPNLTHTFPPGFFIVCNTILCSVGVWNLSLVQTRVLLQWFVLFPSPYLSPLAYDRLSFLHAIRRPPSTSTMYSANFCLRDLFGSL